MQAKQIQIEVECAAGWARDKTLPAALRGMIKYARGFIDPKKTSLEKFIEMVEGQQIHIRLKDSAGELVGITGDKYNEAWIKEGVAE